MDFTPVISQVWGMQARTVPGVLLIGLLQSPSAKGDPGEILVRLSARLQLDKQISRHQPNVSLNTRNRSAQIDQMSPSPCCIFELEARNMNGWIFGSKMQPQWTQKRYKHAFKLQNPLWQNHKQLRALEVTLDLNPEHPDPVINFIEGSAFNLRSRPPPPRPSPLSAISSRASTRHTARLKALTVARPANRTPRSGLRHSPLTTHHEHVQNLKRRTDPTIDQKARNAAVCC